MDEVAQKFPHLAGLPPRLEDSITGTPVRRLGSVRRTSTIDMVWPDGFGTPLQLVGNARDLLTRKDGERKVLDRARMRVEMDNARTVMSVEVNPERSGAKDLVGARGGNELRNAIDRALPNERRSATPLHLLLDDVAGTSLIAGYAWSRTNAQAREKISDAASKKGSWTGEGFGHRKGRIICSGLRPDGWADTHRRYEMFPNHGLVPAGDLRAHEDPHGWHEFEPTPEVGMRRHRRIDVWRDGETLAVESFFRDICWDPDGSQQALHEYSVRAEVDPSDHTLISVVPTPRVLPFPECQWAAPHAERLAGLPVSNFRTTVQETLVELQACTHLNDMLRCLAEVPALAAHL